MYGTLTPAFRRPQSPNRHQTPPSPEKPLGPNRVLSPQCEWFTADPNDLKEEARELGVIKKKKKSKKRTYEQAEATNGDAVVEEA